MAMTSSHNAGHVNPRSKSQVTFNNNNNEDEDDDRSSQYQLTAKSHKSKHSKRSRKSRRKSKRKTSQISDSAQYQRDIDDATLYPKIDPSILHARPRQGCNPYEMNIHVRLQDEDENQDENQDGIDD